MPMLASTSTQPLQCLDTQSPTLDPRESMRALPDCIQPFLTWLTGKPLSDEQPRYHSSWFHLWTALGRLGLGVALSAGAYTFGGALTLLFGLSWLFTVAGARKLHLSIAHACSHEAFSGDPQLDYRLGSGISMSLVTENFPSYYATHAPIHHSKQLMTPGDPTADFLLYMIGLRPDMTHRQMWRRLLLTLVSPVYHTRFLLQRLRSQWTAPTWYRLIALCVYVSVCALLTIFQAWTAFLWIWVVPMTVLYQVSVALRLCIEHRWPSPVEPGQDPRQARANLTPDIFFGVPFPPAHLTGWSKVSARAVWIGKTVRDFFLAEFVVPGLDPKNHGRHHEHPASHTWMSAQFERRDERASTNPTRLPYYTEVWGIGNAINAMFTSLQRTPILRGLYENATRS